MPASVRFRAIEKVIELNGIGPQKGGAMDRHELMEFLRGANINLTQNNTTVIIPPSPYEDDISAYVDGRWNDIQMHQSETVAGSIMNEQKEDNEDQFPATETD